MVGLGFQQQGIHVGMARNTGSFSLYGLSTSYLQSFGGSVRIKRHVLCLERSRTITVLLEYTAKSGSDNTLAYIATRTGKHDGMKFIHIFCFCDDKDNSKKYTD